MLLQCRLDRERESLWMILMGLLVERTHLVHDGDGGKLPSVTPRRSLWRKEEKEKGQPVRRGKEESPKQLPNKNIKWIVLKKCCHLTTNSYLLLFFWTSKRKIFYIVIWPQHPQLELSPFKERAILKICTAQLLVKFQLFFCSCLFCYSWPNFYPFALFRPVQPLLPKSFPAPLFKSMGHSYMFFN